MALAAQYARDINCLKDNQKSIRLPALQRLTKALESEKDSDVHELFSHILKKVLISLLSDPVDKCRELTVALLFTLIQRLEDLSAHIVDIVEAISIRLTSLPIAETVEEIRLQEVRLIRFLLPHYWFLLQPALSTVSLIVCKAFLDPFPLIKQEAASVLEVLCTHTDLRMDICGLALVTAASENFSHQHSKVRTVTISAVGKLIQRIGNWDILKTVFGGWKQKVRFDRTASVRMSLYEAIGGCLIAFSYETLLSEVDLEGKSHISRCETQLIYMLLTGLGDGDVAITEKIRDILIQAGRRRRELAITAGEDLETMEGDESHFLAIVNLKGLVTICIRECTELTVHDVIQSRASIALFWLIRLSNHRITPYIEPILKACIRAYSDTEEPSQRRILTDIVEEITMVCAYDIVSTVLTKLLFSDQIAISHKSTIFEFIQRSIVKADPNTLCTTLPVVIMKLIEADSIVLNEMNNSLKSYGNALKLAVLRGGHVILPICHRLFRTVLGLIHTEIGEIALELMHFLAKVAGFSTQVELFQAELPVLIGDLTLDCHTWTVGSRNRVAFQSLVIGGKESLGDMTELVLETIAVNSHRDKDIEVKIGMLDVLHALISTPVLIHSLHSSASLIFSRVLTPAIRTVSYVSPGRLRKKGVMVLSAFLSYRIPDPSLIITDWSSIFPLIQSPMEDDSDSDIRLLACHAVDQLLELCIETIGEFHQSDIGIALRKRLDDSKDTVRIAVCESFKRLIAVGKKLGRFSSYRDVLRTLFMHLDDPNDAFSSAIRSVLEAAMTIDPAEFTVIAEECLIRQKRQQAVKELLALSSS